MLLNVAHGRASVKRRLGAFVIFHVHRNKPQRRLEAPMRAFAGDSGAVLRFSTQIE